MELRYNLKVKSGCNKKLSYRWLYCINVKVSEATEETQLMEVKYVSHDITKLIGVYE